ncbi:hypothetical protein [uncultured Clostridium sp.]|uniref:hypothetical protein n=1 Tax=uncultured Clostridium sp. TaxID=59620 RepID=UPI003216555C
MLLYPEENLGIYIVSNNLEKAAPAVINIENSFFNKFYPSNSDKITSKNNMSYDEGNFKKV